MLLLDLENRDIRSLVNYSSHTHSFIQSAVLLLKEAIERKRLVTSYSEFETGGKQAQRLTRENPLDSCPTRTCLKARPRRELHLRVK